MTTKSKTFEENPRANLEATLLATACVSCLHWKQQYGTTYGDCTKAPSFPFLVYYEETCDAHQRPIPTKELT